MAFAAIIIVLLVATIIAMANRQKSSTPPTASVSLPQGPWPFEARQPLSESQREFHVRLLDSLPGHIVMPQVGLARFLSLKPGSDAAWYGHIHHLSVDYLVCDQDMQIVAAVVLDAADNQNENTKAEILATAGIKLIRWNTQTMPELNTIAAALI
ncbi:DUF2726 domain-containing protein [Chitinimonas sp.]|uniref:DUF2726 domain-containing protein n=1 Tax=Chitinimonas sp. TaxID=1934313 RepID=UPI002F937790